MRYPPPGRHRSVEEFRTHLQGIDAAFDCDAEVEGPAGPLAQPLTVHGRTIGNRFAIHPMEGWDAEPDGAPSPLTLRRWGNFGRSGAKLLWGGEAFAVRADGRANPNQLYLNDGRDATADLRALRDEFLRGHSECDAGQPAGAAGGADGLYLGLQLTYSGRFCRPEGPFAPRVAYRHPVLDAKFQVTSDDAVLTDAELEAIADRYVQAATHAQAAGFDFVDVKCCHGYLLHELLGAKQRPGAYGGSFDNRTALVRRIIEGIRAACPGLEVGVRVSIADVFPHAAAADGIGAPVGWDATLPWPHGFGINADDPRQVDLEESFRFLQMLQDLGVRLVNLTLGSPYYNPHLQRPAAYPPSDGYQPPEDPLESVLRHLRTTRACKAAFPDLVFVGTGYTYLQEWLAHVGQHEVRNGHVDFVGLGRMTLVYPDLPADVVAGRPLQRKRICRTLSDCTTAPRNGLISGCFPLDPFYKMRPEAAQLAQIKKDGLERAAKKT